MNESPTNEGLESPEEQLSGLRHQFTSALMLLLGMAVVMTWYFGFQFYFTYRDSRGAKTILTETRKRMDEFVQVRDPQFQETVRKLQQYSRTHPDVLPILNKYGVMQATNAPSAPAKK